MTRRGQQASDDAMGGRGRLDSTQSSGGRRVYYRSSAHALPTVSLEPERKRSFLQQLVIELVLAGSFSAGMGALVGVLAAVVFSPSSEVGVFDLMRPLVGFGSFSGMGTGIIAVITGREVVPRLSDYPLIVRIALMFISLVGGAVVVTALGAAIYWRFTVHAGPAVLLVAGINGALAFISGVLVFTYEDLSRRLARTRAMLAAERLAQAQAKERATRAELQALQARINPHFFFNALNTAAAFVTEDPARAEVLLERFAGLFRYAFRRGSERLVTLEEEMDFLDHFLEIERARFGDRLETRVEIQPDVVNELVPPLLLQPLVENAVLHGRDPDSGQGHIEVIARRDENGHVVVEVRDRGPGPSDSLKSQLPQGHALENIAARAAAVRGGWFEIGEGPEGVGTSARVVFPPSITEDDDEEDQS